MTSSHAYAVSARRVAPRTIAAVHARLAGGRIPQEFKRYLDQVYAARTNGLRLDGQNVFVYRDVEGEPGVLDVEFGVGSPTPFAPVGSVRPVELPVGEAAMTTHVGSYADLGAAHEAVLAWCRSHSRSVAGVRWEVYGHWVEGEPPRTDVYYLLQPGSAR